MSLGFSTRHVNAFEVDAQVTFDVKNKMERVLFFRLIVDGMINLLAPELFF